MMRDDYLAGPFDLKNLGLQEPDAIRQMREMTEAVMKPYRDHQRLIRGVIEPFDRARELRASFLKPYHDYAHMMQNTMRPLEDARKMFEQSVAAKLLHESSMRTINLENILVPYRQQQSAIDQILAMFRPRTSVFEEMMAAALQPAAAARLLADVDSILKNLQIERVTATSVMVDGEEISFVDAEEALEEVWSTTASLPAEARVAATSRELTATRQPPLLLVLIAYILSTMFESPVQTITDPVLVPRAQHVVRWLQTNVPSVWAATRTPDIRTVTMSALEMRLCDRRSSTKVGMLYDGDRVEVLKKRKDWSLVVSLDDENVGGWVFSRYLARDHSEPSK